MLLDLKYLADAFRFKVDGMWFMIDSDRTCEAEEPSMKYEQNNVYGFYINASQEVIPIIEVGTLY